MKMLTENRKPDMERHIGGTTIYVYGPGELSDEEKQMRHQAVVRAVAKCIVSQYQPQRRMSDEQD
jgi:hypothetical protein